MKLVSPSPRLPVRGLAAWGLAAGLAVAGIAAPRAGQTAEGSERVTTPERFFGHAIGADYQLPNYRQLVEYWQKLDRESDRMQMVDIGGTAEGRRQYMAIVSSPKNLKRLDHYQSIARRLALADGLSEAEARRLAGEGKAVVWIDGGLHASEVLGAQQLMETVFQLVSRRDPETLRILDDVIVLAVHANPDGHDLLSDWYTRTSDLTKRSTANVPRLYQKYIGHDNNRDFYASTQDETKNMNRVMYREWYPQIVYNHHQTGPAGTVMFAPPFRDPFNYFYDPLIVTGLDLVGAAMHGRFAAENKPGVTMRKGANYSTWWNGGLRTTTYFHNMIGLLTETIGHPTPAEIPFLVSRQLPNGDLPFPIAPQKWHFRQSVDYSVTANYAVLDVASRYRETFLSNIYRMGRNSIERGNRDHWTITPSKVENARKALAASRRGGEAADSGPAGADRFTPLLRDPANRDPRGYILPADQPDFPTAAKFVNTLMETGIVAHRAREAFSVGGKQYPAGSLVVKTAQAFRPHILDMFEPQDHPNDFQYPGGPPIAPYDSAGWTLAFQMGVKFDRILDGFDGPFEVLDKPAKLIGRVERPGFDPLGYVFSRELNDSFRAVNRLQKEGEEVFTLESASGGEAAGTFFVPLRPGTLGKLERLAQDLGVSFRAVSQLPANLQRLKVPRVALWDRYGGSMPSGWCRWLLEQFEFPFEVVYPQALDAGDLRSKYDVIIFMTGAIPERDPERTGGGPVVSVPAQYRSWLGSVSVAKTVPQLRAFLEAGGTVLTVGTSTQLAYHLDLPISDALVETQNGRARSLPREKFYIPGSLLQSRIDPTRPIAYGMPEAVDVMFDESPAFRLGTGAATRGVRRVGWYAGKTPLRSGWAWGQHYLEEAASVVEAEVGQGRLFLFGPEITFRAQPHGTFKLLFNGILTGAAARPEGK